MAHDNLLFEALFMLFLGFLTFMSAIINKINRFLVVLDEYFVLFIFLGLITSIIGVSLLVIWHFRNLQPFYTQEKPARLHFVSYLGSGVVFTLIGFTAIYYFNGLNNTLFWSSISTSIFGIILMLNGLRYFVTEIIMKKS